MPLCFKRQSFKHKRVGFSCNVPAVKTDVDNFIKKKDVSVIAMHLIRTGENRCWASIASRRTRRNIGSIENAISITPLKVLGKLQRHHSRIIWLVKKRKRRFPGTGSNMSCLGDCLDLGPPPDSILFLPPPPVPSFLQQSLPDLLLNTTPCSAAQICESASAPNRIPESGDYTELPRKDIESWSGIGDTWLLVLVASSIGVLLLGALLAMFLLKCREMNMFGGNECTLHRQMKNHETRECSGAPTLNNTKMIHPSDAVLYHGTTLQDNRMVWATLTPRGTQHFISENYPPDLIDYSEEDHYETIDNIGAVVPPIPPYPKDYEYEDPTPLIESYQLNNIESDSSHYQMIGNTDMRCSSLNTLRRHVPISRPRVSSPTRIEHPNLPPLNLYPHKGTLKKNNGTLSYRAAAVEGTTLPKYGI